MLMAWRKHASASELGSGIWGIGFGTFDFGALTVSGTSQLIGGTGKFAEATGGGQFNVSTQYLAADAQGPGSHVFGSQSGTFTGTLTLP
jgi:hypothetical protein